MAVKKGFGYGCKTSEQVAQLKALNLDWFYTWDSVRNKATTAAGVSAEFVPMLWSDKGNPDRITRLPGDLVGLSPKATHILGFNEPDHAGQADMSTGDARRAWEHLEATGLRIGSPATIAPSVWWMNRFMIDRVELESPDLRVDFTACHIYQNPHVGTFLSKIDELHERWGKPVWVTETGVADWDAKVYGDNRYGRTQINEYLAELWVELQKRPWLERFAWKTRAALDPQMGTGALFHTDGSLTSTGALYASL